MVKKRTSLVVETAKDLLKEKNVAFDKWKKSIISAEKLKIIEGNDPEWEATVIEKAALELISEELSALRKNKTNNLELQQIIKHDTKGEEEL